MITLHVLCFIWFIISVYRIKKICKSKNIKFNPYEGTFGDGIGFIVGLGVSTVGAIYFIVKYLP